MGGMVLTRLHLRYGKGALGEDLVFRAAPPIVGGREFVRDGGNLETGAVTDQVNNFQARYAIRHPWTGPVACKDPHRGIWGGNPKGMPTEGVRAAENVAFAPRGGVDLVAMVARDNAETPINSAPLISMPAVVAAGPENTSGPNTLPNGPPAAAPSGGCAGCHVGGQDSEGLTALGFLLAGVSALGMRNLRKQRH